MVQHKRILSSLFFFAIGVALFWLVYRDFNFNTLLTALLKIRFEWIAVSIGFGLVSHFLRAVRWKMLIRTMGYKPTIINLFLSVLVLYFTNLIFPRGGEVSRCVVISKYEGIPFAKLIGTVFVERITDLLAFLFILVVLVLFQFHFFETILNYPDFKIDFSSFHLKILPVVIVLALIAVLVFIIVRMKIFHAIYSKMLKLKEDFKAGLYVIFQLERKALYLILTFSIFLLWLFMLYAVFFAYPPTDKLSFMVAVLTYSFGTLAYLLPIQAGIGTWHFIVINCLFFYGIDKDSGMIFALIAHTFTNLIFLVFGPIAMALLPLVNGKTKPHRDM